MNKEFELDENGNVIDKITFGEVMSIMAAAGYKSKPKKTEEAKEPPTPKKGVLFIDISERGCRDCPCCDGEYGYCMVLENEPDCDYEGRLPECPIKEITITPEIFAERMKNIQGLYPTFYDTAERHIAMDNLMCELLQELGYGEGIDIFENSDKWYE